MYQIVKTKKKNMSTQLREDRLNWYKAKGMQREQTLVPSTGLNPKSMYSHMSQVFLGESLILSEPQFHHQQNGYQYFPRDVVRTELNKTVCLKC